MTTPKNPAAVAITTTTLNYVLAITLQRRDEIARWIVYHPNEDGWAQSLAEANSAVGELLALSTGQSPAVALGRKGGKARVSKGPLANKTPEQRAEWAAKMVAARRAKKDSK
jgi:hypothetical protein